MKSLFILLRTSRKTGTRLILLFSLKILTMCRTIQTILPNVSFTEINYLMTYIPIMKREILHFLNLLVNIRIMQVRLKIF